ncbi:MAG TPA: aldo/keto reductase [Blastocatellia bacterium]
MSTQLADYVTLGRSGLRVSPLCLGTGAFGVDWGTDETVSLELLNRYIEAGGNFFDTADNYAEGRSERLLGRFVRERRLRDRAVIATKFSGYTDLGNPNGGGNGRKNIYRALEQSLDRLETDYIDLYWLHCWDAVTPVEEVVSTCNDLVREGKIRHYGFSNIPAWYVTRAQTIAEREGKERLVAIEMEYSLIERNIEREHVPAARELGIAICPWSPLGGGFLSGKYQRNEDSWSGQGRLEMWRRSGNVFLRTFTNEDWATLHTLREVAKEINKSTAQVALNWVVNRPVITSTIIAATSLSQLNGNLASLEVDLPASLRARLDETSNPQSGYPYYLFAPEFRSILAGQTSIRPWRSE